jgi:two-component system, response regulator YesN
MITLFIVDDEKITRDSIREFIPWQELGVERVETARNGVAALELAEAVKPDIVLTDVRMPKMDGLELTKKLRETQPECKVIFISGYSDKEYLKTAINLKAVSYIEKPLNVEEIKSVVRETVELCRQEEKKRADDEHLRSSLNESLPLLRQEATLELLKDGADIAQLRSKYGISLLRLPETGPFTAACIALNWAHGLDASAKNDARKSILNLLCPQLPGVPSPNAAGFAENDRLAFLSCGDLNGMEGAPQRILETITDLSCGKFTASMGVGTASAILVDIPKSYRFAAECAKMQFYDGCGKVFFDSSLGGGKFAPERNLTASFREALKLGRQETALQLARKLFDSAREARDGDIESVKNAYFKLLLTVFEAARDRNLIDLADENEQRYIWQEIEKIKFLPELSEYLLHNVGAIFARPGQADGASWKICDINKYIRDNISDRDLSVQAIAHSVYLSQTYLCSFYKKMTGKTLNDYMTEVRMERARELLRDRRIKLYEVVSRIGLSDPNYFSTLFKKYTGCTPTEYREKN